MQGGKKRNMFKNMYVYIYIVQISIISQQRKGCLLKGLAFGNTGISKISKKAVSNKLQAWLISKAMSSEL